MRYINIEEIEVVFDKIIEKLYLYNINSIEFPSDAYQTIPTDKWDILNDPKEVAEYQSLYDDIDHIKDLANDPDHCCTFVDFDRMASILRAISQIKNPPE